MNSLIQQYTNQLNQLVNQNHNKAKAGPVLTSSQSVIPTIAWDWPTASVGMASTSAFEFADTLPISCQADTYYQPSSDSFTNNYRNFLSLTQSTSKPLMRLIKKARRKIAVPKGSTANSPTPPGWSIIKINGITRWCPNWKYSDTALNWQQKVLDGSINNPGKITINLKNNTNQNQLLVTKKPKSPITKQLDVNDSFEKVVIEASAWGQISITPDSWYDSSIITLASSELSPTLQDKFFGDKGLLACRLASFYVAYKVKITFHGKNINQQAAKKPDLNSKEILAMGIQVKPADKQTPNSLQFNSDKLDPVIVAVAIEKMK